MWPSGLAVPVHSPQTHLWCHGADAAALQHHLSERPFVEPGQSHWYCHLALIPFLLSLAGQLKDRRKMCILGIWGDTVGLNISSKLWFFFWADKCGYKEIGLQAVKKDQRSLLLSITTWILSLSIYLAQAGLMWLMLFDPWIPLLFKLVIAWGCISPNENSLKACNVIALCSPFSFQTHLVIVSVIPLGKV